jgi:hypothetical protein
MPLKSYIILLESLNEQGKCLKFPVSSQHRVASMGVASMGRDAVNKMTWPSSIPPPLNLLFMVPVTYKII